MYLGKYSLCQNESADMPQEEEFNLAYCTFNVLSPRNIFIISKVVSFQ